MLIPNDEHARSPVFGFMLIGGALVGAQVRDVRLANELATRGYPVHVWWAMDRALQAPLHPAIQQRWLFHSFRFAGAIHRSLGDHLGRCLSYTSNDHFRSRFTQACPGLLRNVMRAVIRETCHGFERDLGLMRRFGGELTAAKVTHLLPNLEFLALIAAAVRAHVPHRLRYLVTFQGYELYANYAREMGLEDALYRRLREAVHASDWPAIAVSPPYLDRIREEVGLEASALCAMPPGIPEPEPMSRSSALELVRRAFPRYQPQLPLISYLGRLDAEKGIDLLLYAAKIVQQRGTPFQLAICGPTAFGSKYRDACQQIAENLRCPVLWERYVPDQLRSALFRMSRCVVYPSIHAEPFGMVPVEAMACGTPVIVPDSGGVASVAQLGGLQGGLTFRSWDSGDLADQLMRLLQDSDLHNRLSSSAPQIAENFSVKKLGDRILEHLDLPLDPLNSDSHSAGDADWPIRRRTRTATMDFTTISP